MEESGYMIVFAKREDTYKTFCTFDTTNKIFHTENSWFGECDIRIFVAQVADVKMLINDLIDMGYAKVSKEEFLERAVHERSGLKLGEYIEKRKKEDEARDKAREEENRTASVQRLLKPYLMKEFGYKENIVAFLADKAYDIQQADSLYYTDACEKAVNEATAQTGHLVFHVSIGNDCPYETYHLNKNFLDNKENLDKFKAEMEKGIEESFKISDIKAELVGDEDGGEYNDRYSYIQFSFSFTYKTDDEDYYYIEDMLDNTNAVITSIGGYDIGAVSVELYDSKYDTREDMLKKWADLKDAA